MYEALQLNRKVSIERLSITRDDDGAVIEHWATVRDVFARVEPLVGREFFAAASGQSEATTKFTMRFQADLTTRDRLVFDGKRWNITAVMNIRSANRETLVMAKTLD